MTPLRKGLSPSVRGRRRASMDASQSSCDDGVMRESTVMRSSFTSAKIPRSTVTFLSIDAGSQSTWTIFARRAREPVEDIDDVATGISEDKLRPDPFKGLYKRTRRFSASSSNQPQWKNSSTRAFIALALFVTLARSVRSSNALSSRTMPSIIVGEKTPFSS